MKKQKGRPADAGKLKETVVASSRENEDFFSKVFRYCPVGMGISRLADGNFVAVNDTFLEIYGYTREEIIGRTTDELNLWVNPEQRADVVAQLHDHGHVRDLEIKCRRKSREIGDLLASAERIDLAGEACFLETLYDITKRKKIEEAFRENERRYRMVLDDQTDVICRVKANGSFTFVNDVYCRFFGKNREELMAGKWQPIAYSDDVPLVEEQLRSLTPTNPVVVIENRVINRAGEIRWMQFINSGLFDKDGRLVENQAVGRDITERKKIEQELRDSEERYRRLFEVETDAILMSDQETHRIIDANIAAQKMYSYTLEEFLRLTTGETSAEPEKTRQALVAEKHWVPYRLHRKKDGTVFPVEIAVSYFECQGRKMTVAAIRDITERKRTEEELAFKNVILTTQNEVSIDGILVVDENNSIISYNRRFVDLWEIPPELPEATDDAPVLQFVANKVADTEKFMARVKYLYENREEKCREEVFLKDARIFERYSAPIRRVDGKYFGRVWYFRDITEQKRTEQALKINKERLELALVASHMGVWEWNVCTNTLIWSPGCYAILGTDKFSGTLDSFTDKLHPEDAGRVWMAINNALSEKSIYTAEFRILRPDGEVRWLSDLGRAEYDEEGKPIRLVGTVQDITDRKKAEQELLLTKHCLDTASISIYIVADDNRILWVNDSACESLGYSREELCSISTPDIDPVITLARIAELRRKVKEQGYVVFETLHQRKDGSRFPVEINTNELTFDGKEIAICFVQDISERKRTEQELISRQAMINSMAQELSVSEERERLRIAEELHDQIAPKLLLSKMRIQSLADQLPTGVGDDVIESAVTLIDQSISEISSLTLQLRPPILATAGLEAALKWLGQEFKENYGLIVKITDDKSFKPLKYEIRSAIFQIARELLLNVVKHAGTKNAWITIKRRNDMINIKVEDDGRGFDFASICGDKARSGGFGLYNTRLKIEHLGGELVMDSSPGSGTRAYINAPLDTSLTEEV